MDPHRKSHLKMRSASAPAGKGMVSELEITNVANVIPCRQTDRANLLAPTRPQGIQIIPW